MIWRMKVKIKKGGLETEGESIKIDIGSQQSAGYLCQKIECYSPGPYLLQMYLALHDD